MTGAASCRLGNPITAPATICAVGGLGRWPLCRACDAFWDRPRQAMGQIPTELSRVPVLVIIRTDRTGHIDISAHGPIKGKAGLLTLLDAARKIAEAMKDDPP